MEFCKYFSNVRKNQLKNRPSLQEYIIGGTIFTGFLLGLFMFLLFNDFINENRDLFEQNVIQQENEQPIENEPIPNIQENPIPENIDEILPNLENNDQNDNGMEEVLGLKGDFIQFIFNCLAVNAIIWVCQLLFIFIPLQQGKLYYLVTTGSFEPIPSNYDFYGFIIPLTNAKVITLGYLQSIFYIFLFGYFLSLIFDNDFSRKILSWLKKVYFFGKIIVFTIIHFFIVPIFCGFVLSYASLEFFGNTEEKLLQTLNDDLISILFM